MLYSWLFIEPSEHHYTRQTSKFKKILNQVEVPTMLNSDYKMVFTSGFNNPGLSHYQPVAMNTS